MTTRDVTAIETPTVLFDATGVGRTGFAFTAPDKANILMAHFAIETIGIDLAFAIVGLYYPSGAILIGVIRVICAGNGQ